jgi:hypothetical protein
MLRLISAYILILIYQYQVSKTNRLAERSIEYVKSQTGKEQNNETMFNIIALTQKVIMEKRKCEILSRKIRTLLEPKLKA